MQPFLAITLIVSCAQVCNGTPDPHPIPEAFGPYINLSAEDLDGLVGFNRTNRWVGTYYFYWYDSETDSHIRDGDGSDALTDHPPTFEDFTYKSVAWHRRQLADMEDAGINVLLPVFWGAPSEHASSAHLHWSYAGLPPLVQAREELLREGRRPPVIGLFYDTSTLRHNQWGEHVDLTTPRGRHWFYATIRDFFSMIPPKHWAMIEGRPIVLLYSAAFAKDHDQDVITFTKKRFARDFGGHTPWIVPEISWHVRADSVVAWGGALGLKNPGIASLGPGYDHSAVPGRTPLVVGRRDGDFYRQNWMRFLRRPSNHVMVETWNEFHEGTEVCETREYGRTYIELTRKYADLFKSGWVPDWPKGPFSDAKEVSITLGDQNTERGLAQMDHADGLSAPIRHEAGEARAIQPVPGFGSYLYFRVDDSFKWARQMNVLVKVEYRDVAPGSFTVEYDGSDDSAPFNGAYTQSPNSATLTGDEKWHAATFELEGARFQNAQNGGADFRLAVQAAGFEVRTVTVIRRQVPQAISHDRAKRSQQQ